MTPYNFTLYNAFLYTPYNFNFSKFRGKIYDFSKLIQNGSSKKIPRDTNAPVL